MPRVGNRLRKFPKGACNGLATLLDCLGLRGSMSEDWCSNCNKHTWWIMLWDKEDSAAWQCSSCGRFQIDVDEESNMNLCINCKHHERLATSWDTETHCSIFDHVCTHHLTQRIDPVTGEPLLILCREEREIKHYCGASGALWEPNES